MQEEQELVAILVSGIARTFYDNFYQFLKGLPEHYHVFLSFPRLDISDHYLKDTLNLDEIVKDRRVKLLIVDSDVPDNPPNLSKQQANMYMSWYRLHKLFMNVPTHYKRVFRCRTDVKVLCNHEEFISSVPGRPSEKTVYIPDGFNATLEDPGVNDQVAWGNYETMRQYCSMVFSIDWSSPVCSSENLLFKHLAKSEINIVRPKLEYKLVLSKCFTIAVCGDSGAGKSTVSELVQEILPYDQTLLFETDRYHRWERGDERYKTITHLNPAANHIEKLSSDTFKLCIGDDIHAVDYDHSTGKFTEPRNIKPSKFMLFCGLHTLYKESMNDMYNLKIFIDTDPELKTRWKMKRDVGERGADMEKVVQSMKLREPDYDAYIKPQRDSADVILYFKCSGGDVVLEACLHKVISQRVNSKLLPVLSRDVYENTDNMMMMYTFKERALSDDLNKYLRLFGCSLNITHDDFKGLVQYMIISLIWK